MATWTVNDAAHLLRRAGFGGRQQDVLNLHALGKEGAIAWLLNYETVPDPAEARSYQLGLDFTRGGHVVLWQLYRMFASTRPLQERLAWFWHGLFTSSIGGSAPPLMVIQMETWRRHAHGNFLAFLKAMYKDPAMLLYLDNNLNVAGAPNENFAREVMELFTLGVGHYTEADIKEAARALTGWVVLPQNPSAGTFIPSRHDPGSKTILGQTGNFNGDQLMDILFQQPVNAQFICTRLYRHFVHPEPDSGDIDRLVQAWRASNGSIKAVMNELLHLDAFWDPATRFTLLKSPVEYVLGLAQHFELDASSDIPLLFANNLTAMGQVPLNPPDVAGYPVDLEWAGTSALLARYNTANRALYMSGSEAIVSVMTQGLAAPGAAQLVDALLYRMGPLEPTDATYRALLDYAAAGYQPTAAQIALKARGLLHLIASSPEYQLN